MATANNTIETRIQLKSDTEANWNKLKADNNSPGFVPLSGELIIYSADSTHDYSRAKIGDGTTNVCNLPFLDAGTISGNEVEIVKVLQYDDLPATGSSDKLYVILSNNTIYHYEASTGYTQLLNFSPTFNTTTIKDVVFWGPGTMTEGKIANNTLIINNGIAPQLLRQDVTVLTGVS